VGAFIRHVVEDAPYRWTCPKAPRACSWSRRAAELERAALGRRAALIAPEPGWPILLTDLRTLILPAADGTLRPTRCGTRHFPRPAPARPFNRIAYSAAHVVADARAAIDPWLQCAIDWDATIAYRQRLWSLGLGVAEAMDTAQRGMGLDWPTSLELIRRSLDAARDFARRAGGLAAAAPTTWRPRTHDGRRRDPRLREQMAAIEALGGKLIVMASRALARVATSPADYERVYDRILSQAKEPVVMHWLGDMFDPALAGYWGSADPMDAAMDTALGVIAAHADKVDGIKISLLDKDKEIAMRRRLPPGVRMYTGDDFNYAELIAGDGFGATHPRPQRRAAGHLRRHRAGGQRRAGALAAG
jgi:hypothetical protein